MISIPSLHIISIVSTRFVCLEFHAVVYAFSMGSFLVEKYCITLVLKLYMFSALRFHLSLFVRLS